MAGILASTGLDLGSFHGESTCQYGLVERAVALGWVRSRVLVIDEDLGHSASGIAARPGFARLVSEVGLDHVGIVLGVEMSRLARSGREWHQLHSVVRPVRRAAGRSGRGLRPGRAQRPAAAGPEGHDQRGRRGWATGYLHPEARLTVVRADPAEVDRLRALHQLPLGAHNRRRWMSDQADWTNLDTEGAHRDAEQPRL